MDFGRREWQTTAKDGYDPEAWKAWGDPVSRHDVCLVDISRAPTLQAILPTSTPI